MTHIKHIKVGPARYKKVGLAVGAITWLSAATVNFFMRVNFLSAFQLAGVLIFLVFGGTYAFRHPIEVEFTVGNNEKHTVKFVYKQTLGETLIRVDKRQLVKSDKPWHSPYKEEFKLVVGDRENHDIIIQRKKSLFAAFSGAILLDIKVDGESLNQKQVNIRHTSLKKQKSPAR